MTKNICIITPLLNPAGTTPLSNLVKLVSNISHDIYVVSGGSARNLKFDTNVQVILIDQEIAKHVFIRIINYLNTQIKIMCHLVILQRKTNLFIFTLGGECLLFPILSLKLLRKKIVLLPGGITSKVYSVKNDPLSRLVSKVVHIGFDLSDKLILYSTRLIHEGNLEKYAHKMLIAHRHFVDFTVFKMHREVDKPDLVGYIGRLSEEKGILNFIRAVPIVLKERTDVCFMVFGEGELRNRIENTIRTENLHSYVKMTGWVPHKDLSLYLNRLSLLVLPSFTEGLPNIILEAMACGTPVLATPVGAIPDIIKEGETGFLLKSNDPKHMAERIAEILDRPEVLEKVSINAYNNVRKNFSYENTLKKWQKIIADINVLSSVYV